MLQPVIFWQGLGMRSKFCPEQLHSVTPINWFRSWFHEKLTTALAFLINFFRFLSII